MNAEQLHTIATTVIEDVRGTDILTQFARLSKQLNSLASNPGDENVQRAVQDAKVRLFESLEALDNRRWSAGIQQAIADLRGPTLDAREIQNRIEMSLQTEAITPATVRDLVSNIQSEINDFVRKLETLCNAFRELGIEEKKLEEGEVELGVLIPRNHIESHLDKFAEEVAHFDEALKLFSVVATGTREDFDITELPRWSAQL